MLQESVVDLRGIPTAECPMCGSNIITINAVFDSDYEISLYMLDAECAMCHTRLTAPTPLDLPMEM
jgi:C4-type Zn-finger protein